MKSRTFALFFWLVLFSCPATAAAQSAPPELTTALEVADAVVYAEIIDVRPRWEGGLVVSTVLAEVRSCLSGDCPVETVSYEVFGGEIDGLIQVIEGSSVPSAGQGMVLLLVERRGHYQLASAAYGMLPIVAEAEGGQGVRLPDVALSLTELLRLAASATR